MEGVGRVFKEFQDSDTVDVWLWMFYEGHGVLKKAVVFWVVGKGAEVCFLVIVCDGCREVKGLLYVREVWGW